MAFSALSLSTTTGVQGRPYRAVLNGTQAGSTYDIGGDGSPGFSIVNGRVSSEGLPYPKSTLVVIETRPGEGRNETRFDISASGAPVANVATDGTITYTGAGGGAPTAQASSASASGPVYTVPRLLGSTSNLALITGTNSNLTLNATTGVISATAAIAVGASQTAVVSETLGTLRVDYPVVVTGVSATPTPAPTPSAPTIAFAAPTASVTEGDSGTKTVSNLINVTRNGVTGPLTVNLSYSGTATSGTDYVAGPVSGTIADGQTSLSFDLTINGDTGVESDETIVINAVLDAYSSATTSKTITVTNDDATTPSGPLATWKTAYTAAQSGNNVALINDVGDSTTVGVRGGPGSSGVNANDRAFSYPAKLSAKFIAAGMLDPGSDIFGFSLNVSGATINQYPPYNNLVATASGSGSYGLTSTLQSVGGLMFVAGNAAIAAFQYTPPAAIDTVKFYYPLDPTLGATNMIVDGAQTGATISQVAATASVASTTFPLTLGTHTVGPQRASGLSRWIGMEAYNSANKRAVRVRNMGWSGSKTSDWIAPSNPVGFGPSDAIAAIPAHLTIVNLGINEWNQAVPVATFSANIQTLLNTIKAAGGSILILGPFRTKNTVIPLATQDTYVAELQSLASSNGCDFLDLKTVTGSWETASANGQVGDTLHPNGAGYQAITDAIYARITAA